jgi:hypothetical protein
VGSKLCYHTQICDWEHPIFSILCVPSWKFLSCSIFLTLYEGVSESFWTGHLERELQMVQFSATRCTCIMISWVSLVSFATITLCVPSWVFTVIYFIINSVRKLLDTPSSITYNRQLSQYRKCEQHVKRKYFMAWARIQVQKLVSLVKWLGLRDYL